MHEITWVTCYVTGALQEHLHQVFWVWEAEQCHGSRQAGHRPQGEKHKPGRGQELLIPAACVEGPGDHLIWDLENRYGPLPLSMRLWNLRGLLSQPDKGSFKKVSI